MSILIKGMAIPKNCGECPCYYDGYCQGIPYNEDDEDFREVSYKEYDKKRRDDCPLIELPPHGRLIDADALYKVILEDDEWVSSNIGDDEKTLRTGYQCAYGRSRRMIRHAPTIIESEENDA